MSGVFDIMTSFAVASLCSNMLSLVGVLLLSQHCLGYDPSRIPANPNAPPPKSTMILTEDFSTKFVGTFISQASWTAGRRVTSIETCAVACATKCAKMAAGSYNAIMYVRATGECHMGGGITLPTSTDEPTEFVYMNKVNNEPKVQYFATESQVGDFYRSSSIGFNGKPENFGPQLAVDGKIVDYAWDWFSTEREVNPWLEVKLSEKTMVSSVTFQGNPVCCWDLLKNVEVRAGLSRLEAVVPGALLDVNTVCGVFVGPGGRNEELTVGCSPPVESEYITLQMKQTEGMNLQINELKVNGAPNTGENFMK